MSDRQATDFSMDAMIRDLTAVVEATSLESAALWGWADAVPIAITYATQNRSRITHLVLLDAWISASDYRGTVPYEVEEALRSKDPSIYLEALARFTFGAAAPEMQLWKEYIEACADPGVAAKVQIACESWDVSSLLAEIAVPTLIIHNRLNPWIPVSSVQRTAAQIPRSRLAFDDDWLYRRVPELIREFLLGKAAEQRAAAPSGTAIILFADIVDSTALTERLGYDAFRDKARGLDEAMRAAIRANGGTAVEGKTLGDGVLAVFTSAKQAIACAQACHDAASAGGLSLHAGIHAGDVIREADNVYGGAVNIAARVAAASAAGETLVSGTVRDLARTSAGVSFEDRGEHELKGVGEPQRLFAVVTSGQVEA